jgi:hypothetical protein
MKMTKRKLAVLAPLAAVAICAYLVFPVADAKATAATGAKAQTYSATVYVAGHGGHFSKADVTVDPSNADDPIKVTNLEMVSIGTPESHKTHDARLDANDKNTLFWSTIALDKEGKMHVGKTNLKTGEVVKDVALTPDPRSPAKTGPVYCASGQSKDAFMPVFMGSEGYIDVFDKKTMAHKRRVFISDLGFKPGTYQFLHGTNSNDLKRFLMVVSVKGEDGNMNGKQEFVMLDLPALEKGKFKVLARNTLAGEPGKTITFRQYFSRDDKLIFQSAADRMWVLDAKTLKLVDEKMTKQLGENHDVQPTPDAKYALLTLRTADTTGCDPEGKPTPDKKITDGVLALYDAGAKKLVGKPTSVCFGCHKDMGKGDKNAVLCGLATVYGK